MVGAAMTVKLEPLVAVPPGVVTVTVPVDAPLGTLVVILVSELTWKLAVVPLNFTAVAPVRFVPVIVTGSPTPPLVGLSDEIVGAAMTVKLEPLVAVPFGVVTVTVPVDAPLGTLVVILVSELTWNVAAVPLNFTAVAPVK